MNRLFIRESQGRLTSAAGNPIDKVNIAVTGLGQNVGTTFVASSLAFYFAEKGNNLTFYPMFDAKPQQRPVVRCSCHGSAFSQQNLCRLLRFN